MNSILRLLILLSFAALSQQSSLDAQPCNLCGTTASEWIAGITIDGSSGLLDIPGGSLGGCLDQVVFDAYVAILKKGVSHTFTLTPGFSGATKSEYWKIWVDLNHDGDFDDTGDLVYTSGSGSTTTVSGSFFIPLSVNTGPSMLRVAMRRGSPPPDCGNYANGQVLTYKSAYIDECDISFTDACAREYIKQVNIQYINNTSSCGASGYQDFTNISTTLNPGNTYPVQLTPGFFNEQHPERWLIWIDFNNDYDFDDPGELVFDSGAIGNANTTNGTINIPSNAPTGTSRMRIKMIPMDVNSGTLDPCDPVPGIWFGPDQYGEAEDYSVTISNAPPTPTFLISTSVNNLSVCAGTNGSFTANLTSIQGFNSPVTLTVTGGPAGSTVNISPNPVIPSGLATVTLSGLTAGMAGSYAITVTGVSGNVTRTTTVTLVVSSGPSGVPFAISPMDGASGISTTALLTWTAVADASIYCIDLSTNPSFPAGSLLTIQTNGTNGTVSGLQLGKVYYWRIQAKNACGSGTYSTTYAFQTSQIQCEIGSCVFTYVAIDPNTINTIELDLDVPFAGIIKDVNVNFRIAHSWVGDLSARLVSPYNDNILLFDRPGVPASPYGCESDNVDLTFDNQAALSAEALENQCNSSPPALSGTFQPIESLNVLNGKNTLGNWRLFVTDNQADDGGGIDKFCLSFCMDATIPGGSILTNNLLTVNRGSSGTIDMFKLKMNTTGQAFQGQFIVLRLPVHGSLLLNGVALGVGGTFTQSDINSNLLVYQNNCDPTLADNFQFDALDQNNNAWVHDAVFNINIIPINLIATASQTGAILCHDGTTGAIKVTANPPNGLYTYRLNGGTGQSSSVFSGLSAGAYTVVVTDQCGATVSTNPVTLTNPTSISVSASVVTDDVTVTASGGTGQLQYSVNGGAFQSSNIFNNLANGNYTFTVRDANGCTATVIAVVNNNPLSVTINIVHVITCAGGNDGAISVTVNGGQAPYTYRLNGGNSQNSNVFNNLASGTYSVVVTDNTGSSAPSIQIVLNNPPVINVVANAVTNNIVVTASGGTGTLKYSINGTTFQTSNQFSNLCQGTYTVTVRDANNCTATTQAIVTVNSLSLNLAVTHIIDCAGGNNGALTAMVTGGQSPFTYSLNGGSQQSSAVFNNLMAGNYNVVATDNTGCSVASTPQTLINPPALQIATNVNGTVITVQASGGTGFLQYSIDGINFQAGNQFSNLSCNNYTVTVRDANGCTKTAQAAVNVLTGSFLTSAIPCFGGSTTISLSASCGLPPYMFKLGNGQFQSNSSYSGLSAGTYSATIKDMSGATINLGPIVINQPPQLHATATVACNDATLAFSGGTPPYTSNPPVADLKNLSNGTYNVTTTDGNGCTVSTTFTINMPPLAVSFSTDSVKCFGGNTGSITANGTGGCPPYMYSLNGSVFQTSGVFSNLSSTPYTLHVKDDDGNLSSTFVTVFQPVLLGLSATVNGNTITANANGGTLPYQYRLNNGPVHSTGIFSNLSPGIYTVVCTDAHGCTASKMNLMVTSGTVEPSEAWGLSVSPNPSTGLYVLTMLNAPDVLHAEVFDVTGRLLQSLNLQPVGGQLTTPLDLRELPQGTYMLWLSDGQNWGGIRLSKVD